MRLLDEQQQQQAVTILDAPAFQSARQVQGGHDLHLLLKGIQQPALSHPGRKGAADGPQPSLSMQGLAAMP